ncbi:MAG: nucleotidyltransferase domain-containing protein [bacterium]
MRLDEIKKIAEPACKEFGVDRLYVFGSTVRGTRTITSDLDFLVEFKNPSDQPAKRFFGLLHRLEDSFKCKVDLLTQSGLKNPYFKRHVHAEMVIVYEG